MKNQSVKNQSVLYSRVVGVLMLVHALLVAWCALRYGFAWTEVGLLPAGILDWRYGTFDVFRVNPPLIRMWGTLPAIPFAPEFPFSGTAPDPRIRAEWDLASRMIEADPIAAQRALSIARLACIPFSLAGLWVAARWGKELFGNGAGVGAAILWAFFPYMIGYGSLISGDAQAASMGLVTFYLFRRWLAQPDWTGTYFLGIVLGLTLLTKTSWLILLGLLPLLWMAIRAGDWILRPNKARLWKERLFDRSLWQEPIRMASVLMIALFLVNLLYGFGGSFRRLDSYEFISKALAGSNEWEQDNWSGNRFQGTWLGLVPVPLPEDMVIGIDLQKWDFDRERWSYFRGEWRDHGWWYYYLYGLGAKLQLGFWMLFALAVIGMLARPTWRAHWSDELLLWTPMVLILTAASLETGLNRHLRYVLPALPFGLVIASRSFLAFREEVRGMRALATGGIAWMIGSSLWIYPHSLSYFNESIGGPKEAHWHFNASNLDWGQDFHFLRQWQLANPEKKPLYVTNYLLLTPPQMAGIESAGSVPTIASNASGTSDDWSALPEGWYAIDRESILRQIGDYRYLQKLEPVGWAGYGFQIFEITPEVKAKFGSF